MQTDILEESEPPWNSATMAAAVDQVAGNGLVRFSASTLSLKEANNAFPEIPQPSTQKWNAIISAHVKGAHGKRALELYHGMRQQGFHADIATYLAALKACAGIKDLMHGNVIHMHVVKSGLENEILIGSTLVDMYGKSGSMGMACLVFNKLEHPNVVPWSAMVAGYAQCGQGLAAIQLVNRMNERGIKPDKVMFLCILKACCSLQAIGQGRWIHNKIVERELESDIAVASSLVDVYAKCGSLDEAENIFERLSSPNVVTWSTLIAGYALHNHDKLAIEHFEKMQRAGVKPGRVAFLSILKASGNIGAIAQGRLIHDHVIRGTLNADSSVGNTLVDMYSKCGSLSEARRIFNSLRHRTVVSYSAIIAGYAQHGHGHIALELYDTMLKEGIKPDRVVFLAVLKACAIALDLDRGKCIHYELIGSKLELDITIGTALVEMYVRCGCVGEAWELFRTLPARDGVLWSTMLMGFVDHKQSQLVFQYFKEMQQEGIKLDTVLLLCVVKATTDLRAVAEGRLLHKQVIIIGLHSDVALSSSLMDLYAKCGSLEDARKVFDDSNCKTVVSWGAMIAGHVQYEQGFAALDLYNKMQQEGLKPEDATFVFALKACCCVGALEQGRLIHAHVVENESESDIIIGNTLIDLYGKCNMQEDAQRVFDSLSNSDVVSWSALVSGYAMVGNYRSAKHCLDVMRQQGLKPDNVLFTSVLSAFSHAGLIEEGQQCLQVMAKDFGFRPSVEHYNCVIDLLGRSGSLKEGRVFLQAMPVSPNAISWTSLLTGCKTHGHKQLARLCFEESVQLERDDAASYVIMSDLYTDAGKWDQAEKIEEMKRYAAAWKEPGRAWIEINCRSFEFLVGNKHHTSSLQMHAKLYRLGRIIVEEGNVPQVRLIAPAELSEGTEDTAV